MHRYACCFFFSMFSFAQFGAALAEEAPGKIPLVVDITSTRTADSAGKYGVSTKIIDSEQISQSHAQTVGELLDGYPGLGFVSEGRAGGVGSLFIRGAGSEQTLVLIDGIPANDATAPGRGFDFSQIPTANIGRIEILRGSQSSLYGSDAIGGVVRIVTKKESREGIHGRLHQELGSYSTFKTDGSISAGESWGGIDLDAAKERSKGFSSADKIYGNEEPDGYTKQNLGVGLRLNPSEDLSIKIKGSDRRNISDADSSGGPNADDLNFVGKNREQSLSLNSSYDQTRMARSELDVSQTWIDRGTVNGADANQEFASEYEYKGARSFFSLRQQIPVSGQKLVVGIDNSEETMVGSGIEEEKKSRAQDLFFEQLLFFKLEGDQSVSLSAGGRLDLEESGNVFTYRVSPKYSIANTAIRASIGTGYKRPSIYQKYSNYGDTDLKSERASSWDVGVDQAFGGNSLLTSLTYFENKINQQIDFDFAIPPYGRYANIKTTKSRGIEAEIKGDVVEDTTVGAAFTYLEAKNLETGDDLLRRPRRSGRAYVSEKFLDGYYARVDGIFKGERMDGFAVETLPAYSLYNISAGKHIGDIFELYGKVENAFDRRYQEILGYGTAARSYYAGARLTF